LLIIQIYIILEKNIWNLYTYFMMYSVSIHFVSIFMFNSGDRSSTTSVDHDDAVPSVSDDKTLPAADDQKPPRAESTCPNTSGEADDRRDEEYFHELVILLIEM